MARTRRKFPGVKPRPRSRKQARVWNYFNRWDHGPPIRDWPYQIQNAMMGDLNAHKNNRQRMNVFFYLVANGFSTPLLAKHWVLGYGGPYDRAAQTQMHWIEHNWHQAKFRFYSEEERRYVAN